MKKRASILVALGAILASSVATATPPAERDSIELLTGHANRYVVEDPGTESRLSLLFGPYTIPPGQDSNRITLDLPPIQGFITAVAPELVETICTEDEEGEEAGCRYRIPTEQEAHIHHAHWFRIDLEGEHEQYTSVGDAGLSWVFGTGEEKTQGLFEHRWDMDPDGPMYGMPVEAANPQALIYMIHNKTAAPLNAYVVLDVRFVHGDEASIEAARGRDIRPMEGTLWGQTRDATLDYPELSATYESPAAGTIIAMGSHLHPSGKFTVVANLGPDGVCREDLDGDGFPGTTILMSRKFDRIPGARVYSEDYQMGATKFGWRAPIREGDHLVQYAPYAIYGTEMPETVPAQLTERYTQAEWNEIRANDPDRYVAGGGQDYAAFEAMTYTGMYVDRAAPPEPLVGLPEEFCQAEHFAPWLLGGEDTFETQSQAGIVENTRGELELPAEEIEAIRLRYNVGVNEGMINHAWVGDPDELCGLDADALIQTNDGAVRNQDWFEWDVDFASACDTGPTWSDAEPMTTDTIQVGGFVYWPGDLGLTGPLGAPPRVQQGTPLTLVNLDAAINVRHTFTSCPAPCNGAYVANYPLPDGRFDSDKMGNVDPIDGGFSGDWQPIYQLDTSALEPGTYPYYCRIHPWMRGAFEIVG